MYHLLNGDETSKQKPNSRSLSLSQLGQCKKDPISISVQCNIYLAFTIYKALREKKTNETVFKGVLLALHLLYQKIFSLTWNDSSLIKKIFK